MPSVLNVDTLVAANGTDPVTLTKQSAAKAWANTSGDGTPVLDNSFNTASLTDNGTGSQSFNFTNNASSSNYSANGTVIEIGYIALIQVLGQASSNVKIKSHNTSTSADSDGKNYTMHGDLA